MKFKRSVKVVTILAILVVTLSTLSIQEYANTPVSAHTTATDPNVITVTDAGKTYSFSQVAGSSASNTDSSIDTGTWTMTQGSTTVGTIDINETVSNSVRLAGKYAFQTTVTSTIPGLQGYSSNTVDYPVTESGYGSLSVSPWGDQAAKYTSNDYAIAAPDSGTTTTNTSGFLSLAGAGSTGYNMYNNMVALNNEQITAYQKLENFYSNAGAASDVGQPSTSAIPMAFHSPAQVVPTVLLTMGLAGAVIGTTGLLVNVYCGKAGVCGNNQKAENILFAIVGMTQEIATWVLFFSGWTLAAAHRTGAKLVLPATIAAAVFAEQQAYRNVLKGAQYAAAHGTNGAIDADIENEL